jgi:transcriptional regulator GlxA family with amidase domain
MLRMENAWMMLETGDLNVSEVALATGFTCFGHFAGAFRIGFGITPRDFKNWLRSLRRTEVRHKRASNTEKDGRKAQ